MFVHKHSVQQPGSHIFLKIFTNYFIVEQYKFIKRLKYFFKSSLIASFFSFYLFNSALMHTYVPWLKIMNERTMEQTDDVSDLMF